MAAVVGQSESPEDLIPVHNLCIESSSVIHSQVIHSDCVSEENKKLDGELYQSRISQF